jgi:hypothetical protein
LPIRDVDSSFEDAVPVCTELSTSAGIIDVLLINRRGLPVVVECKLWRNPEARRKVIAQILDYAKELSKWNFADLEDAVKQRLSNDDFSLIDQVAQCNSDLDSVQFVDDVTRNLQNGRVLVMIVGDGIREGVERIVEFLKHYANIQFSFGLVEAAIYQSENGLLLIQPRILAHSEIVERSVIEIRNSSINVNDQKYDQEIDDGIDNNGEVLPQEARRQYWLDFWKKVKMRLTEKRPDLGSNMEVERRQISSFYFEGNTNLWMVMFRHMNPHSIGIYFSGYADPGLDMSSEMLQEAKQELESILKHTIKFSRFKERPKIEIRENISGNDALTIDNNQIDWFVEWAPQFYDVVAVKILNYIRASKQ